MQRYLPYSWLFSIKNNHRGDVRETENELRRHFGYPEIGKSWITETILYNLVCVLFPGYEVIHHYRGRELEGLELDIWMPGPKIGIEYQGEQHYVVVGHWGGKAGLEKRQANDRKKRKLCKAQGYHLIEFKHSEDLTEKLVKGRIEKILNKAGT